MIVLKFAFLLVIRFGCGFTSAQQTDNLDADSLGRRRLQKQVGGRKQRCGGKTGGGGGGNETRIQILGNYNMGTNLLESLICLNFPYVNTRQIIWKHESLRTFLKSRPKNKAIFRRDNVVAVAMIRDPISWLHSMKKAPYDLKSCLSGDDWLTRKCSWPHPKSRCRRGCPEAHWNVAHFTDIQEYWNWNVGDYENLADFGFGRAMLVRYEDLVLNVSAVMTSFANLIAATPPVEVHDLAEAANTPSLALDHASAVAKLVNKSYLSNISGKALKSACERLDVKLMRRHGYFACDPFETPR